MRELLARASIGAACLLALLAIWSFYVTSTQAAAPSQSANAARRNIASVRDSIVEQDASVLRYASTRDPSDLEPYLKARRTFDADLAGFNAQLSAVLPHHRSSVVDDLRATYHAWLTTVARPLVYVAQKPRRSVGLLRRDKALMDHMRLDFNALFAAADAVDVRPEANSQRIVAVAVAVAALVVVLLSAMVLIAERRGEALDAERKQVFETVDELVGIADYDGHLIHLNAGWQRKLGYTKPELASRAFIDLVHPDDRGATAFEIYRLANGEPVRSFRNRFRAKDGTYHAMIWNAVPDRARRLVYVSARDETEQVRVESELADLSYADPLTGLPNRRQFFQQLQRAINMARRHRLSFSVLYLDLDQLKHVNDTMSHAAGDEALKGVAANISARLRESDLFARVGGDEFGILTPPIALPRDVNALAQKIVEAAAQSLDVGGNHLRMTVSLGVANYPEDGTTANDLLAAADRAMYSAKRAGGGAFARVPMDAQQAPPGA